MLSRHNVIQAFMNLGIVFSKHYELGIQKLNLGIMLSRLSEI